MDFVIVIVLLILGNLFVNQFKNKISEGNLRTLKNLFIYHIIFGIYFCFFAFGDAIGYWRQAKMMTYQDFVTSFTDGQGTFFIHALNYFPANVLDLSYFTGTMIYTLIGFIGLSYFYIIAVTLVPNNSKISSYNLFPLLFFFPNLHFWSCGVGKDSLLFFCIAIFCYGLLMPFKRLPMIILGLSLAYFIRPHITLFMLLGFGMAYFSGKKIATYQRVLFFGIMIGVAFTILPMVLKFAKIEQASIDDFNKFSSAKAAVLGRASTGSAVDLSSYPFPVKVFTFLFRPLFFDINGIPSVLVSFENLLLLVLTFKIFRTNPIKSFRKAPFVIQGMIYFLLVGTFAFSQTLGNLGIMIRMRNMFLPGLIIYIFWHFSYLQNKTKDDLD